MLELVTAIIKPHKLDDVKEALLAIGVEGLTVTEVRGFGRQRGKTENFRGSEYQIDFIPEVKVEVVVAAEAAKTDKIGDGKIWAVGLDKLLRVRTGEAGIDAI